MKSFNSLLLIIMAILDIRFLCILFSLVLLFFNIRDFNKHNSGRKWRIQSHNGLSLFEVAKISPERGIRQTFAMYIQLRHNYRGLPISFDNSLNLTSEMKQMLIVRSGLKEGKPSTLNFDELKLAEFLSRYSWHQYTFDERNAYVLSEDTHDKAAAITILSINNQTYFLTDKLLRDFDKGSE